jgi:hypothetical protein
VTIITTAFKSAGEHRLRDLGLLSHPMVVVEHPMASRNAAEVEAMARSVVDLVVKALVEG